MFLYELALELDVRSVVLLDRAHALGMDVDPTSQLTAAQVEQLRAAYGKGRNQASPIVGDPVGAAGSSETSWGMPAVVAMVVAGLVVVLMIGYAVTNSDSGETVTAAAAPDDDDDAVTTTTEPCDTSASGIGVDAIGQDTTATTAPEAADPDGTAADATDPAAPSEGDDPQAAGGTLPPCDVAGGLSDDEIAAPTTEAVDAIDTPRDKREFCKAAISALEFEARMFEAADAYSLGPIRDVMIEGRDRWKIDITIMTAAAPPRLDVPLERYRIVYTNLLDAATPDADDYELAVRFNQVLRTDLEYYAIQLTQTIAENCDKR